MNAENENRIPFPEKIIGWYDIIKGLGDLALHSLFDSIHHEARPFESEHHITDTVAGE